MPAGAADSATLADSAEAIGVETVVVTGTRFGGISAADSAAPISVLDSAVLTHAGAPDLNKVLNETVPSFQAEAQGYDLSANTLSARLRGLSPNDTLILVNGKRRHITGSIHADGEQFGVFQGADSADLNLIPTDAIARIEVLQDGASAQYGSDAIAGVINILLKDADNGGLLNATAGQYYKADGDSLGISGNVGFKILDHGFLNLTAETRYHGFSRTGGLDGRYFAADGTPFDSSYKTLSGYPYLNKWSGDAESNTTNIAYNAGYDFGNALKFYSFGTYSLHVAQTYENYRSPSVAPLQYPQGFSPREYAGEKDFAATFGVQGNVAGWAWDLSSTYGRDAIDIWTLDSTNTALYAISSQLRQSDYYDGAFIASQWTTTLDVNRSFDVGLAGPLGVAFGGERREDAYGIKAGEYNSYYAGGAQAFPGFTPSDAGNYSRKSYAGYVDLSLNPIDKLKIDAAGRYEHFSDFGHSTTGKVTVRYDFTEALALRGTIATGFRAPTLAEEYYSATNVGPTWATVVLPPNSAAAAYLGLNPLKPEHSTQYSVGVVAHLLDSLTATIDAYSIALGDRIVSTGDLVGRSSGVTVNQRVLNAVTAHGNDVSNAEFTSVSVDVFTNGVDTLTKGIDLSIVYHSDFGAWGAIDWSLNGNYGETTISRTLAAPSELAGTTLFDKTAISNLTTAAPKEKVSLNALYTRGAWTVNLRETIYGPSHEWNTPDYVTYYKNEVDTAAITNLDVSYDFTSYLRLTIGANNLFNQKPNHLQNYKTGNYLLPTDGVAVRDNPNPYAPYGTNGGSYYARVGVTF